MVSALNAQPYLQTILSPAKNRRDWKDFYTQTQAKLPLRVQTYSLPQRDPDASQEEGRREQMEVLAGLRQYAADHVLLIGNPGSGKSTALRRLLWEEAERCVQSRGRWKQTTPIPVLLELRGCRNGSVLDWLKEELRSLNLNQEQIQRLLDSQCLLLLFDGLNELPFRESWQEIDNFRKRNLKTPMIFTTRKLEAGSELGIEKKLEMMPLSESQVREFIEKRLPGHSEVLLRQLQSRLRELAETPLLLKILCDVFVEGERIPQNRGELFGKEFSRRYNSFKESKTLPVSEASYRYTFDLLQHLAVEMMQGDGSTSFYLQIPRSRAEQIIAQFLVADDETSSRQRSKEYLEDLLEHQLLQLATDPDQVEFHHQLFQEYYAAEWLCCQLPNITNEQLECHYLNYLKWTEAIALMMGLLDNGQEVERLVKLALHVDLSLGARLAGEVDFGFQERTVNLVDTNRVSTEQKLPNWLKIELLGKTRSKFAVPKIRQLFDPQLANIACAKAIHAFKEIESETAISELLQIVLNRPNQYLCQYSAESLIELGTLPAISGLVEIIKSRRTPEIDEHVKDIVGALESINGKTIDEGIIHNTEAFPLLVQLVQHSDCLVRYFAASILGLIGGEAVVPHLNKLLQDEDAYIREVVVSILGEIANPNSFHDFLNALDDEDSAVKEHAVDALCKLKDSRAVPCLIKCLSDLESENLRSQIVQTLSELNCQQFIQQLIKALNHKNPWVRCGAAAGLGQANSERAIAPLLKALRDSDGKVRENAQKSLAKLDNSKAVPELLKLLKHKEDSVRLLAIETLGDLGNQNILPHLFKTLKDDSSSIRGSSIYALESLFNRGVVDTSFDLLHILHQHLEQEEDELIRCYIVKFLGHLKSETSINVLTSILECDSSRYVWDSAFKALIEIGEDNVIQPLKEWGLENRFYSIALYAAKELIQRGYGDDVTSRLLDFLTIEDNSLYVRREAAGLLADLQVEEAVPALLRVFDNPIKPEYLDFVSKYSTEEQWNWYGIEELAKIGNEEAISRLLTELEHTNAGIRIKVVNALRYLKSDCAVDALLRVLQQDENLKVRQQAAEGLEEIEEVDTSRVLPDLLELMPTQSGEQVFSVISVIPSIQKRCQFYNYKVYQQAKLVEKGLEGKGATSMKNIRIEGAEVVQIIESNHGNVSGKTIIKRDF